MRATVATPLREIKAAACYPSARWRGGISAARAARLRGPLERLYRQYDYDARIGSDAIQYPARYRDPLDREIVALLSACLAYGRVSLFGAWLARLLGWLGPSPRAFVEGFDPARDAARFAPVPLPVHAGARRRGRRPGDPPADRPPRLPPGRVRGRVLGRRAGHPAGAPPLRRLDPRAGLPARRHGAPDARLPPPVPGSGHGGRLQALAPLPPVDGPPGCRRTSGTGARSRRRSS